MLPRTILFNAATEASGGTTAATPPPAAETPAEPKPNETKLQRTQRTAAELDKWLTAQKAAKAAEKAPANDNAKPTEKPADKASEKPAAEPSKAVEAATEALEDAGGKAPKQQAGESDAKYEKRLLDALQKQRELEGETARERKGRTEAEAKAATVEKALKELEAKLAKGKDPALALEFLLENTGLTFEDLVKGIKEKRINAPGQRAKLDPESQARLDKLEAENKRLADLEAKRQEEHARTQQQEAFKKDVTTVTDILKASEDDYPLLAASEWAPGNIVNEAYQSKNGDVHGIAKRIEENTATNIAKAIGNEKGFKKLLKHEPELKAKIVEWLDLAPKPDPEPEPEAKPAKKARVQDLSTEVETPNTKGLSASARKRQAAANLETWLREQKEQAKRRR